MSDLQYSKNTVGCRVQGEIFIHPELYKYPKLYQAVVGHEKKHSDNFNLKDVSLDLFNDDLKGHKKEFYKFILTHPRALLGWFPLTKIGRYWAFDPQMFFAWIFTIGISYYIGVNL